MNHLRIFLLAALVLVVFGIGNAEAKESKWDYTSDAISRSVAISSDGNYEVSGHWDGRVVFFQKSSNVPLWEYDTGSGVFSVAISKDGNYTVAGTRDDKVVLFSKLSEEPLWEFEAEKAVISVDISDNGNLIVAGSEDNKVYLLHKNSSTPEWYYEADAEISSVSISGNGNYVVAGSWDHNVYFFSKNSNEPLWSYDTGDFVNTVAISSEGNRILSGSNNGDLILFNKETNEPLWTKKLHEKNRGNLDEPETYSVISVDISSDGETILASGSRGSSETRFHEIFLFDASKNEPMWSYWYRSIESTEVYPKSVMISGNGEYIIATFSDKVSLFHKNSSIPIWSYYCETSNIGTVAISFDGKYIVTGSREVTQLFWTGPNPVVWSEFGNVKDSFTANTFSTSISSNGDYMVAISFNSIRFFSRESSEPIWTYTHKDEEHSYQDIKTVVISSDGNYIAAGTYSGKVYFFEKTSNNPIWEFNFEVDNDKPSIIYVDISEDGEYIVAGSEVTGYGGKLYLFNKETNVPLWNFTACSHEGCQIRAVAISEDGEYIVSGGDHESGGGGIYFFDKDSSSPLIEYDTDKEIRYVAISEDGDYFVAASNELVYFFDRYESSPLWTRSESVTSISINDGGDLMAIATQNGYLYVFDSTGSKNFEYHFDGTRYGNHLYAVDISADGKYVSAGSQGGLVILVSLDAGEVLGSIRMMDGSISSISISENGDYIIAGAGYSYSTNSTILLLSNNFTFEEGCMDINAINFNPEAVVDDGSCNYIPPSAQFTWSYTRDGEVFNQSALEGFPTNFDASLSSGYNLGYEWDFGDGSTATGPFVSHTYDYKENGFEVTLTVIDQLGNSHSMSYKIIPALKARPDIYISTLTFSDDNPEAGDEIIINATVKLLRMEIEDSFEVTFYLDGISGEWCLEPHPSCIGRQTVHRGTLSVGDEHTVSLNWNATEGPHTIYVVADSTYKIDESDEKNELSRNIIVLEKKDEGGNASFACQGGESKIAEDGCNQCVCSDGNWVCTEIDCAVSDEEGLLPSVSLLTSLISIGLLAIFRRK